MRLLVARHILTVPTLHRGIVRGPRVVRLLVVRQAESALLAQWHGLVFWLSVVLPWLPIGATPQVIVVIARTPRCLVGFLGFAQAALLFFLASFDACPARCGEEVVALRWLLAALLGQLGWSLDGLAVIPRAVHVLEREYVGDFAQLDALEDGLQVRAAQSLLLQQLLRQSVQVLAVVPQDGIGGGLRLIQQCAHFVIDQCRDFLAWARLPSTLSALCAERIAAVSAVLHRTNLGAHAQLHDHGARSVGGHLDIGRCAGGGVTEHQLLSRAATHGKYQASEQLRAVVHALVVFWHRQRMSTSATTGEDGHLVHAVNVLERPCGQGVSTLVVGRDLLLLLGDDLGGTAWSTNHAVGGFFQCIASDDVAVHAGGQQRGLIQHVLQVCAGHASGALGQRLQIHICGQRLALGVHAQDLLTAGQIRVAHGDLTVKTARAQQRRVQDVRTVGRGHEDHAFAVTKTIHLHQQLVQGLLTLVVSAAHAGATLATHGVDLIHEDDARRVLLGLLEQVAHAGRAHAHEHLYEVGTRDGVERNARLASHCAGQQGLTRSGRAVEQYTAGDLGAQFLVARRVGQEVADLVEFLDCLVRTGNIVEGGVRVVLVQLLVPGLAHAKRATHAAAVHAAHQEQQQSHDQNQRQEHHQQGAQEAVLRDVGIELLRAGILNGGEDPVPCASGVTGDDLFDAIFPV